jgi:FkbM family methyltransferase
MRSASDLFVRALRPLTFRGKMRLLETVIPYRDLQRADVFGYCLSLDLADQIQRNIYFGTFERLETALVRRYLQPGMTVVDVGANVGYYTMLAASIVGEAGRVCAIEPSPDLYRCLEKNVKANCIPQVQTVPIALGDADGDLNLYVPKHRGNNTPTMIANAGGRPVRVRVRTLDQFMNESSLHKIDLLKIDVEGYEARVLAGAKQALSSGKIGSVLCEFNDYWLQQAGSSARQLWTLLTAAGFEDVTRPTSTPTFRVGCLETRLLVRGAA